MLPSTHEEVQEKEDAQGQVALRIVSLSGGATSAVCADKVIQRYGSEHTELWFADTRVEDADLYRFLNDLECRWHKKIIRHADGRTPLEVAEDKAIIPNQKIAPCTFALKIDLFTAYLKECPKPVVVSLGMAWWEKHRMATPKARYEAIPGVTVDYPSLWKPLDITSPTDTIRSWGIQPPRMYARGWSHNNCSGACVKQGAGDWLRLLYWNPALYEEYEAWEQMMRASSPNRAKHSFLRDMRGGTRKPLTLLQLRHEFERGIRKIPPIPPQEDDAGGCLQCSI